MPQLDGGAFSQLLSGETSTQLDLEKTEVLQNYIVQTNGLSVKEMRMLQNVLLRNTRSSHSLLTIYPRLPHSRGFMDKLFKHCEHLNFLQLPETLLPTETLLLFTSVS